MILFLLAAALQQPSSAATDTDTVQMPADEPMSSAEDAAAVADAAAADTQANAEAYATGVDGKVAIECQGNWFETTGYDAPRKKLDAERRIYILDEERNTVSYWNRYREMSFDICDRTWPSCQFRFEPTQIEVTGKMLPTYSVLFSLSRRSGNLDHFFFGEQGKPYRVYTGTCDRTEMPESYRYLNKF